MHLKSMFAKFSNPIDDNGPEFKANELKIFAKDLGFQHEISICQTHSEEGYEKQARTILSQFCPTKHFTQLMLNHQCYIKRMVARKLQTQRCKSNKKSSKKFNNYIVKHWPNE